MTVRILMATYQGERYLPRQLASFATQTERDWQLVAGDDGSRDGTLSRLKAFQRAHPSRVCIDADGDGGGPRSNFSRLLVRHGDADYLALADQDDVWEATRLESGLRAMRNAEDEWGAETPLLVHSDLRLVDGEGRTVHPSMHRAQRLQPQQRTGLRHLLPHNNVTGCATLINRALRDLAVPIPEEAIMHDWWLALVAAAFGRVVVLDERLVAYRQHGRNALGARPFTPAEIARRSRDLGEARERLRATYTQAAAFLDRYGGRMEEAERALVTAYARLPHMNPLARRATMVRHRFTKAGLARTAGMFALL